VELRLLSDTVFVEEFDFTVDELIDQYVAGEVDPADLPRFEEHFLKSDTRAEKLRFAYALKKASSEQKPHVRHVNRYFRYLAVAASIVAIVGLGFFAWRTFFYRSDVDKGLVALQSAFKDERPFAGRITGFNYAPVSDQRGGESSRVNYLQLDYAGSLLLQSANNKPNARAYHAAGQYYLAQKDFDKAIDQLKRSIELDPNNANAHIDLATALLQKGILLRSESDSEKPVIFATSLEHFNRGLELNNSSLEGYFNRALLYQNMGLMKQAEAEWQEYLKRDSSSPWAEEARRNLKLLQQNGRGSPRNIDDSVNAFLDARRKGNDDDAWRIFRESYSSSGNQITLKLIDAVLTDSSETQLDNLSYLAQLESSRTGDRYSSHLVSYYQSASLHNKELSASALRHMTAAYDLFAQSKYAAAIQEYNQAKSEFEGAGNDPGATFAMLRLAQSQIFLPDLNKAREALKSLLEVCERNNYRWLAAQCLYSLAHASADNSEYTKAISYSSESLKIFEQINDQNGRLRCFVQLAAVNQELNRNERALSYLSRGIEASNEHAVEPTQRWGVLVQTGFSMTTMQLPTAALFYQREALEVAKTIDRPLLITRSHGYVGSAYAALKKYSEAEYEVNQALITGESVQETGGQEMQANAWQQLGDVLRNAGQCDRALTAYDKSIELYSQLKFEYFSYAAHKGKLFCLANASNEVVGKELRTVLDLFEQYRPKITTESQRDSFFAMEHSVYDFAIHYELTRMNDPEKAFEYSEVSRARSLLDAKGGPAAVLNTSYGPDLNLKFSGKPLTRTEIQKHLPENVQILQTVILDDRVVSWVVTKMSFETRTTNIDAATLDQQVKDYLKSIVRPPVDDGSELSKKSAALFDLLIRPVAPLLDRSKTLCIVSDKILNYLPYAALMSPEGKYLTEQYDIVTAPSSSVFINLTIANAAKPRPASESLVAIGNPAFDHVAYDQLQDLPAAEREVREIAREYPASRVLIGPQATEKNVKAELQKADVIHLAAHYLQNEKSEMLSGFPLSVGTSTISVNSNDDGFLQAHEIYSMKLSHTSLAVLSACQTGIERQYDGEGAVGVARPFLVAGVSNVVASLWSVDSESTAELMIRFHQHRVHENNSPAIALKLAQIDMAHNRNIRFHHPYYWAPFVVVGAA
jgi:CHAT domain-containing protein/tetratricopeptide (TPR) repeat protein